MPEPLFVGQPVTLRASFGPARAGKPVGYTWYNADGSVYAARSVAGVVDDGGGFYRQHLAAGFPAAFDGWIDWDTGEGAATVHATEEVTVMADIVGIVATEAAILAQASLIRAKTDTLGAATVIVQSPVAQGGRIQVEFGDDYLAANQRSLPFTFANVPDLTTAATLTFYVDDTPTGTVTATDTDDLIVELTQLQTGSLTVGQHTYRIVGVWAAHVETLTRGILTVTAR